MWETYVCSWMMGVGSVGVGSVGGSGERHAGIRMQDDDDVMELSGWRCSKEKCAWAIGCRIVEFRERSKMEIEIEESPTDRRNVVMARIPIPYYRMIPYTPKVHCRQHLRSGGLGAGACKCKFHSPRSR